MIFKDYDRIVFAGDSITDMNSMRPVGEAMNENLGTGYVRFFESLLSAVSPELKIRVTNSGIGANSSRDLLARWQRDVVDLHPDWVSILIGVNDVWRQFDCPAMPERHISPEEYESNLEAMILAVRNTVKGIFLMTPYYMETNRKDSMRVRLEQYAEVCKKLAQKHQCILVDLQKMFDRYFQYRHPTYIAWDGVHPNQVGAALIAQELLKKLTGKG